MNVSNIFTNTRLKTWYGTNQISDANALILLNEVYRDLINLIKTRVNEWFFYYKWTDDTSITDNRYSLNRRTATEPWLSKLLWLSVKYKSTDQYHTKFNYQENIWTLTNDLDYYKENQSNTEPFYCLLWEYIHIFPTPTEVVTWWINFYWIADPIDLLTTSIDNDIKIPTEWHEWLVFWLSYKFYEVNKVADKMVEKLQQYEIFKEKMVAWLTDRNKSPIESQLPYLSHLS